MLDRSISQAGAARLRQFIVQGIEGGSLVAGEKLPTERELVKRFTMARSAVRKTLATLEAEGRIARSVGRGTFVAPAADAIGQVGPMSAVMSTSPAELMAARLLIEPALTEMVVTNATSADLEHMETWLDRAEAASTLADFERYDSALHEAIVAATHNSFLIKVYSLVNSLRQNAEWGKLKERSVTMQRRLNYQREHRLIVAALKERDASRARATMIAHLRHVRRNMFGY